MQRIDRTRWAHTLRGLRRFFDESGYLEVSTDHVVPTGAVESNLDSFRVVGRKPLGELHTSPELAMKEALAEERRSMYQICRCFRDDPTSPIHSPEFTMLEWYRIGADFESIIEETLEIICAVTNTSPRVERVSCRDAIFRTSGIDIAVERDAAALYAATQRIGYAHASPTDTWEDLFFRLVLDYAEKSFDPYTLTVLDGYPTKVSPLAKSSAADAFFANRFEIFWQGMELCNGCEELDDPEDLRARLAKENAMRVLEGKPEHGAPEALWRAFAKGFPGCSGVALGVERLALCQR